MEEDKFLLNSYRTFCKGNCINYEIEFLDYFKSIKAVEYFQHGEYFQQEYVDNSEKKIQLKLRKYVGKYTEDRKLTKLILISSSDTSEKYHFDNLIDFEVCGFYIKFIYKKKKLRLG